MGSLCKRTEKLKETHGTCDKRIKFKVIDEGDVARFSNATPNSLIATSIFTRNLKQQTANIFVEGPDRCVYCVNHPFSTSITDALLAALASDWHDEKASSWFFSYWRRPQGNRVVEWRRMRFCCSSEWFKFEASVYEREDAWWIPRKSLSHFTVADTIYDLFLYPFNFTFFAFVFFRSRNDDNKNFTVRCINERWLERCMQCQ